MLVVTQWIDALNAHDLCRLEQLYAPEYRGRDVSRDLDYRGYETVRTDLEQWMQAFPDLRLQILQSVCEASRVCFCWTLSGTHSRSFLRIPPTGRRVRVSGFSLVEVQDGRLASGLHLWDMAGMLRAMRLLPELPRRDGQRPPIL